MQTISFSTPATDAPTANRSTATARAFWARVLQKGFAFFCAFALLATMTGAANAVAYTWNGVTSSDWNTSTNWTPAGIPNATGDSATFPATIPNSRPTANISAPVTVGSITFAGNGYTVSGSTLTLGPTVTVTNAADTATISALVNGTLTKAGNGRLNLTNTANTITGAVLVSAGTFQPASVGANPTVTNFFRVGTTANVPAIMNIVPGAVITRQNLFLGDGGAGTGGGAIYQSGGSLTTTQAAGVDNLRIGSSASGYGYYNLSGGTITVNQPVVGASLADTVGVVDMTGGTLTANGQLQISAGTATSSGLFNATGGSVVGSSDIRFFIGTGNAAQQAVLNIGGGSVAVSVATGNSATLGLNLAQTGNVAGMLGVVNLLPNGTLTTGRVLGSQTAPTTHFNFNGGTLQARLTNNVAIFGDANLDAVNVYSGGGTLNNNGTNITIDRGLLAPTGFGVSGATIAVPSGGSGYIGAPLVKITGGTGTGATGYAVVTGGVVSSIVVTSPGIGYSAGNTLTATFFGGGYTTAATAVTGIPVAANTSGGMTFTGTGTTTLSGANTYSGATTINGGPLVLATGGSLANSNVFLTAGSFSGRNTVQGVTVGNSSTNILTQPGGVTLTTGSLTFNGAARVNANLAVTSATPFAVTGALATTPGNGQVTINVTNSSLFSSGTTYNLFSYGTFNGSLSDFTLGTVAGLSSRQSATLGVDTTNKFITLTITGENLVWTGAGDGTWSTSPQTPPNWKLQNAGTPVDYIEGDNVIFDDSATVTAVVISASNVNPTSTIFTNSTKDYTLSGGFGIAGAGIFIKSGTGLVTLTNPNPYTGATTVSAGSLQLGDGTTDGNISSSSGIANSSTLVFNRVGNFTYSGVISGTGTIIKLGGGTQILSGTNTYTGTTTISAGVISVSANPNLGANAAPVTLSGGTLRTSTGITNTHPVTIGANGGTINVSTNGQYFFNTANTLFGSGPLTVTGSGTLTSGVGNLRLAQANTYSGTITLQDGGNLEYGVAGAVAAGANFVVANQGELIVQNAITLPNAVTVSGGTNSVLSFENGLTGVYSGNIALNANTIIGLRDWYNYATVRSGTISGVMSGIGGISLTPGTGTGGVLTLSGANAYSGDTNINAGTTLALGASGVVPDASAIVLNGGALSTGAGGGFSEGTTSTVGLGNLSVTAASTLNYSATSGTANILNFSGAASSFAGNLTINNYENGRDRLFIGSPLSAAQLGATGSLGQIRFVSGPNTFAAQQDAVTGEVTPIIPATTAYWTGINSTSWNDDTGNWSSTPDGLTPRGKPDSLTNVVFSATSATSANTTLDAAFTIRSLTIQTGSPAVTIGGTNVLSLDTLGITMQSGAPNTLISTTGGVALLGEQTWTNSDPTNTLTVSAPISGAFALTKAGAGTVVLSGANTYTGITIITAGTLRIGDGTTDGSISSSSGIVNNGTLIYNRVSATIYTSAVVTSGTGNVIKSGSGTQILTGINTYTGGTTVNGGLLTLGVGGAAGAIRGTLNINSGATVNLTAVDALGYTAGTRVDTVNIVGGTINNGVNGNNGLDTNFNLTGATMTSTGGGAFNFDGTFGITSNASSVTSVISAPIALRTGTVPFAVAQGITTSGIDLLVSGAISGANALTKSGVGTLQLSGGSSFSGDFNINGGLVSANLSQNYATTVSALGSPVTAARNINVNNGATLRFDAGDTMGSATHTITTSLVINAGGIITNNGTSFNSLGPVRLNGGTLTGVGGANAGTGTGTPPGVGYQMYRLGGTVSAIGTTPSTITATSQVNAINGYHLNANTTFDVASGATLNVSAPLINQTASGTGAGALTKTSAGTLTLTGANTYTGTTTISAGTVQIGNGGTTGSIGAGAITDNAALVFNRSNALSVSNIISGSGTLDQSGSGTLTLTGANTYTGATSINAGTLQVGNGTTDGSISSSANIVDNGALIYNRVGNFTYNNVISGTGTLTKIGAGTQVLNGANTYSGATTISAGTLNVTGSIASSSLTTAQTTGTLSGTGTVGAFTAATTGIHAPGVFGPGLENVGNYSLVNGSTLQVDVNGTTVGNGYDQVNVMGTVDVTDATLSVTSTNFTPAPGTTFVLINNDETDAVTGTFAGLAEGATFTSGSTTFRISYAGGTTANDVVLTALDTTPPTVLSITRVAGSTNPTSASSVSFTVTFSEAVTGVDASDFVVVSGSGVSGATVTGVAGSGALYTVTVGNYAGNGTVRLDLIDDDSIQDSALNKLGGSGTGATGNGSFTTGETFTLSPATSVTSGIVISEMRLSGPGTGSGDSALDEFIELANTTGTAIDVSNWSLVTSGPGAMSIALTSFLKDGASSSGLIPAGGHLLIVNSGGYSLGALASGNVFYSGDIDPASTLTLKNEQSTVVDAIGNLSAIATPPSSSSQYSYARRLDSGTAKDTGVDSADFNLLDTGSTQSTSGSSGMAPIPLSAPRLGAPGPQNLSSPLQRNAGLPTMRLVIPAGSGLTPEARYVSKGSTLDPKGRLSLRRTLTNTTGAPVTRLRFRIVSITGGTSTAGAGGSIADLRALSSAGVRYYDPADGTTIRQAAIGMTLDAPSSPTEAPLTSASGAGGNGGGVGSSWTVTLPGGALSGTAPNNTLGVEFLFGIVNDGSYRVVVDAELLP